MSLWQCPLISWAHAGGALRVKKQLCSHSLQMIVTPSTWSFCCWIRSAKVTKLTNVLCAPKTLRRWAALKRTCQTYTLLVPCQSMLMSTLWWSPRWRCWRTATTSVSFATRPTSRGAPCSATCGKSMSRVSNIIVPTVTRYSALAVSSTPISWKCTRRNRWKSWITSESNKIQ